MFDNFLLPDIKVIPGPEEEMLNDLL